MQENTCRGQVGEYTARSASTRRGQRGTTDIKGEHLAGAVVGSQFSIAAPVDRSLDLTGRFVRGEVEFQKE
jgi:hypothetical protein